MKNNTFNALLKAAEQGDVVAQYNVAVAYHYGDGVKKDDKKAFKWGLKAAQQGKDILRHKIIWDRFVILKSKEDEK